MNRKKKKIRCRKWEATDKSRPSSIIADGAQVLTRNQITFFFVCMCPVRNSGSRGAYDTFIITWYFLLVSTLVQGNSSFIAGRHVFSMICLFVLILWDKEAYSRAYRPTFFVVPFPLQFLRHFLRSTDRYLRRKCHLADHLVTFARPVDS